MSYVATFPLGLGATPAVSTTVENSVASGLATAAAFAGPAAPFLLIAASIAKMLSAFGVGAGCGQPCLLTTEYANQANALLQQNIATYFCPPDGDCSDFVLDTPRSQTAQAAAMANFNTIWNELVSECSQVSGSVGQQCISERAAGGCQWTQPASSVSAVGDTCGGRVLELEQRLLPANRKRSVCRARFGTHWQQCHGSNVFHKRGNEFNRGRFVLFP